jgi:hypothetical protein
VHLRLKRLLKSQKGINQKVLDQIPAEFIHVGGGTYIYVYIYIFFFIENEEELPQEGKESSIVCKYKKDDKN